MTSIRICCGDLLLALDVDEAEAVGDLPADEEVAPQRLLLGERLVLVDGLDRQVVGLAHRVAGRLDLAVAHEQLARGRRPHAGHHLDQGRLAGAVVADQADDLVASDGDVDVAQRVHGAEVLLHAFEAHDRGEIRAGLGHTDSSLRRLATDVRARSMPPAAQTAIALLQPRPRIRSSARARQPRPKSIRARAAAVQGKVILFCRRRHQPRPRRGVKDGRRPNLSPSAFACIRAALPAPRRARRKMERAKGIEPSCEAWEASVLPLNYARAAPVAGRPQAPL